MVPPAAAYAWGVGLPVWINRDPTRSAPRTPSTKPCTWNSGRPWTSVSSGVHCHASANPSRSAATARRDSTTPFGRPVVPDVYMINAVASAPGSATCPLLLTIDSHLGQGHVRPLRVTDGCGRAGVAQHVLAFHRPGIGGQGHHRNSGDQPGHDADDRVERVGSAQRDSGHAGEPLGHRTRTPGQSSPGDGLAIDTDRAVGVAELARQRRQQCAHALSIRTTTLPYRSGLLGSLERRVDLVERVDRIDQRMEVGGFHESKQLLGLDASWHR